MRKTKLISVALAAILTFGAASPAFADCCDSFWDCAATVVTEGVSCAMQEFIDTVKGLITMVNNLMSIASGAAENAQRTAQQAVSSTIDAMTSQSQSSDADLAQAAANAKRLADEESQFPVLTAQKVDTPVAGGGANAPAPTPRPGGAKAGTPAAASTGAPNSHVMTRTSAAASAVTTVSPSNTSIPIATPSTAAHGPETVPAQAPPRAFMSEMNRALAEITKAKGAGDQDLATVNRYIDQAKSSEGSGIKSAEQIANDAINAPFKNLLGQLGGMLTNPTDLTSPSSAIEAMANSIIADLSVNIDKVIGAITSGPKAAFDSAEPSYSDLQSRASNAQDIASAMDRLYHERTTAAHAALVALLPGAGAPASNPSAMHSSARASTHIAYSAVKTRFETSRQQAKTDFLGRFQEFDAKMRQYEGVREKLRTTRSSLSTVRTNFSAQLDAHMNGKTQAERTAQRDSLIAEARTHFANDPKTRDAVISLLTTESSKRIAMVKR